jgi:hypothetical protein
VNKVTTSGLITTDSAFVTEILKEVGVPAGSDWCAAFVSWAYREATNLPLPGKGFPYNASTQEMLHWFQTRMADRVTTDAQDVLAMKGAIFIATDRADAGKGHMGFIVNRFTDSNGRLTQMLTCEGNTTDPNDPTVFGAFLKQRVVGNMVGNLWSAVHYIHTIEFCGGSYWD